MISATQRTQIPLTGEKARVFQQMKTQWITVYTSIGVSTPFVLLAMALFHHNALGLVFWMELVIGGSETKKLRISK